MIDHNNSYKDVKPIVFDVDGVLCDTGTTITPEFQEYFLSWMKGKPVMLVTGSEHHKTRQQIGDAIVDEAMIVYNCLGNSVWMNGEEVLFMNPVHLTEKEHQWILNELQQLSFPMKNGHHIEHRRGSINLSFTGRPASPEVRQYFKTWDEEHNYRFQFLKRFNENNPRLEAFIGGDTSVDICLKYCDKGQIVDLMPSGMDRYHFTLFADKCFPGGIDSPLMMYRDQPFQGQATVHEVQGYQDTWKILREQYT